MLDLDWMESVKARLKRKNQVLFSPKDDLLAPLALLLEGQDRRAVVLWAFALVEETVERLEQKYPGEDRPRTTLELCRLWAAGTVKMPQAKAAILACLRPGPGVGQPGRYRPVPCRGPGVQRGTHRGPRHGLSHL